MAYEFGFNVPASTDLMSIPDQIQVEFSRDLLENLVQDVPVLIRAKPYMNYDGSMHWTIIFTREVALERAWKEIQTKRVEEAF